MIHLLLLLLAFFAPLQILLGQTVDLSLRGRDRIRAEVLALESDGLRLRAAWSEESFLLPASNISCLLREVEKTFPSGSHSVVILRTGDRITGELIRVEENDLILRSAWEREIRIDRQAIREIEHFPEGVLLFRGPAPARNWSGLTAGSGVIAQPIEVGGGTVLTGGSGAGTLSLKRPLDGKFRVDIELQHVGADFRLHVRFPAKLRDNATGLTITLSLSKDNWAISWLRNPDSQDHRQRFGNVGGNLAEKNRTTWQYRLYFDVPAGKGWLYLNGALLQEMDLPWLPLLPQEPETAFHVMNLFGDQAVFFRSFTIRRYEGDPRQIEAFVGSPVQDCILLRDGRSLAGTWLGGGPDGILFATEGQEPHVLPLPEILRIIPKAAPLPSDDAAGAGPQVTLHAGALGDQFRGRIVGFDGADILLQSSVWSPPLPIPFSSLSLWNAVKAAEAITSDTSAQEEVHLLNGDRLTGAFLRQEGGRTVFQPNVLTSPIRIPSRGISYLLLTPAPLALSKDKSPFSHFQMVDGSFATGHLQDLSDSEVELTAPWGQPLNVALSHVREIEIGGGGILFHSRAPSDWTQVFKTEGRDLQPIRSAPGFLLPARSSISAKMDRVPERLRLDIALQPPEGPNISWAMQLGLLFARPQPEEGMVFNLGPNRVNYNLFRRNGNAGQHWFIGDLGRRSHSDPVLGLSILVDLVAGKARIMTDEGAVHEWALPQGEAARLRRNPWINLTVHQSGLPIHIRSLRVTEIASFPTDDIEERALPAGMIRMLTHNGDTIPGKADHIRDGVLTVITPEGMRVPMPLARIRSVAPSAGEPFRPRVSARDVVVGGGRGAFEMTMELLSLDESALNGRNEIWGKELRIPRDRIEYVRFNPYTPTRSLDLGFMPDRMRPFLLLD